MSHGKALSPDRTNGALILLQGKNCAGGKGILPSMNCRLNAEFLNVLESPSVPAAPMSTIMKLYLLSTRASKMMEKDFL